MLGAHELLLIVRAQNQASAALGRVGRDIRRLQAQRDLGRRQAQLESRLASQRLRVQQIESDFGSRNLAIRRAQMTLESQIAHVKERDALLEQRRAAIIARGNNLLAQQERYENRILGLEGKRATAQARIASAQATVMATERKIADLSVGGVGRAAAQLGQYRAKTGIMQAELQQTIARRRLDQIRASQSAPAYMEGEQLQRLAIANRQVAASKRAYAIAESGVKGLEREIQRLEVVLKSQSATVKGAQAALANLDREEKEITASIQRLNDAWTSLSARERAVQAAEAQHARQLEILNVRLHENQAAAMEAAAGAEILRKEMQQTAISIEEVATERALQRMERMRTIFAGFGHVGRVAQMFGMVGTAAAGFAAASAARMQTQSSFAATQTAPLNVSLSRSTEITMQRAAKLQRVVLDQMKEFPASGEAMNKTLYDIYSSINVSFGGGQKLLKLFNQAAVAGQAPLEDVSNALITLANNWHINANNMDRMRKLTASTMAAVRFGRMTLEQYTQTMNQLAPAFKTAHQSIEQMNGAIAFMTRLQPSQRFAATGLARLVEMLQRVAPQLKQNFGTNVLNASGNLMDLDKVIAILIKRFPQLRTNGAFLTNFFKMVSGNQGTVQARRALSALVLNFGDYRKVLQQTSGDQGEFTRSLQVMEKSTGVRWEVFLNNLKAIALELGTAVTPMLLKFGDYVQRAVKWFEQLSPSTRKYIGEALALSAILSLIGGSLLTIIGGFGVMLLGLRTVGKAFGIVGGSAKGATGEVATLGSEAGFIGTKGLLGLGIPVAIVAMIRYHHQVGQIVNALGGLHTVLGVVASALSVLTFRSLLISVARLSIRLGIATGAAETLIATLGGLSGLAFVIPITYLITEKHTKGPARRVIGDIIGNKPISKGLRDTVDLGIGLLHTKAIQQIDPVAKPIADLFDQNAKRQQKRDAERAKVTQNLLKKYTGSPQRQKQLQADLFGGFQLPHRGVDQGMRNFLDASRRSVVKGATVPVSASRSIAQWISMIQKARAAMLGSPHDYRKARAYENLMDQLAKTYKGSQLAAIQDVLNADTDATKKRIKNQKDLVEKSKSMMNDLVQGVTTTFNDALQQNHAANDSTGRRNGVTA